MQSCFTYLLGRSRAAAWMLLASFLMLQTGLVIAADAPTGKQIYQERCASCHSSNGQGTDDNYPHPLAGERTVPQLARFIARSMPKDAPKKCTSAEAEQV